MIRNITFLPGERAIFAAPDALTVSQWAEKNVVVPDGPYSGARWRNDVVPYLTGIMDAWGDDDVRLVVVAGVPQSGKTRAMHNCLLYSIARRRGTKMMSMPDDVAMDRVREDKLTKSIAVAPKMKPFLRASTRVKMGFSTGDNLYFASARSASDRASITVRDLFGDELDLYVHLPNQTDPEIDFEERTESYGDRAKVFWISKPVGGKTTSRILRKIEVCDENRTWEAECPVCRGRQSLVFEQLKFLHGCRDPKTMRTENLARYECVHCKAHWNDHAKRLAVSRGRWIADAPASHARSIGFTITALMSPFIALADIAADFLEAKRSGSTAAWMKFYNSRLAEGYDPAAKQTDEERVLSLRCPLPARTVPAAAVALTCGIDVQQHGFWFVVRAWAEHLESWLVDYGFLPAWDDVQALVFDTRYPVEGNGREMGIWRAAMDSGGTRAVDETQSRTEEVYQFVRKYGGRKLFAVKGASRSQMRRVRPSVIDKMKSGKAIPGGLTLYILDTHEFKDLIYARMEPEHIQPMHLHSETGVDYAAQICAEKCVLEKGQMKWVQVARHNHLLDCEVMAAAAADQEWFPALQAVARRERSERAERSTRHHAPEKPSVWPKMPGGMPINPFAKR